MSITDKQKNFLYDSNPVNPVFMRFSDSGGRTIYLYGFRDPRAYFDYTYINENVGGALLFGKKVSKNNSPDGLIFRYDDKPNWTNITGVYKTKIPENKDHLLDIPRHGKYTAKDILSKQIMITYKRHFLGIPIEPKTIKGQTVEVVCSNNPAKRYVVLRTEKKNGGNKFMKIRERTLFKKNQKILNLQRLLKN